METLKPCPFCGGSAGYSRIPGGGFSVLCKSCGAIAMPQSGTAAGHAATAWNRRTVRVNFQRANDVAPCPFCASRAAIAKLPGDASILKCQSCGVMVSFADSKDLAGTVARWNRRKG